MDAERKGDAPTDGRVPGIALGVAAGFSFGYAAMRAAQTVRDLRRPAPPLANPDPRAYGARRRALAVVDTVRGIASLAAGAFLFADPIERRVRPLPRPLRAPAFALAMLALDAARDTCVDYVEGYVLERTYGTSEQTPRAWFGDAVKETAIGAVATGLLVALADALVVRAPRRWPWIAIAGTPPLLAFATVIVPTFIMPLFNQYEPLTGALEERIRALATSCDVGDASILRFDMSRRTKKANAFVTGVLGTERIALADTLVDCFEEDETLFVVAHELGHYVRRDPWLGIALGTLAIAATLLAADASLRRSSGRGLTSPAQGARLAFYATIVRLGLMPATNAVSRAMERRADRFAVEVTGDRDAGGRAFRRLAEQNLTELDPPRWAEFLFASHPSLQSRIDALRPPSAPSAAT